MSKSDEEIVDRVRAGADFTKNWMSRRSDILRSNISENRSLLGKVKEFVTGKPSLAVGDVFRTADIPIVKPPEDVSKLKATVGGETVMKGGVPVEIRVYPRAIRNADTNGVLRNFRGEYAETTGSHEQGHAFDEAAKNAMSKHILNYLREHKLLGRVMYGFSSTVYKTPEEVSKEIYAGLMEARRKRQANPEVPAVKKDYEAISVLPEALINSRLSPEDLVNIDNTTASHSTGGKYGTMAAAKAGDAGYAKSSAVPSGHNPALDDYSGPRIVINPSTFRNEKDGLCVTFDEAFRILMEVNGFDPVAEPTEKQRQFFADTAYANDERMLRRTILARICTFDTSVTDPTDEQLQEAVEFLDTVMEIGAPQNEWEQRSVQRIRDTVAKAIGQPRTEEKATAEPPAEGPSNAAAGGGETEEDKRNAAKEFVAANGGGELADGTKVSSEEDRAAAKEFVAANGGGELADGTKVAAADTQVLDQRATGGKTASERIGTSSGMVGVGGRELTAGEAAWQARRQASTQAWMQRTGRNEDVLNNTVPAPDQVAQVPTSEVNGRRSRDEGLFQNRQIDSGRRDRLGRRLDDRGRVIA